ncbi:MAG: 50S ribosomal protein L4 [Anaerolineales bacterium]|nr:50S ribosomal protein L4 [Anaerolineales bacterium]
MKVEIYNMKGNKAGQQTDLPEKIFEAPVNVDLMHQAFVRQMANARLGTHKTKTRHEVQGGGKKPWRQKGTGNARTGSRRAAQWVGGGKIHTPRPRDYTQKMPRKMRRAALRSALSVKAADQEIIVVDTLKMDEIKTRTMQEALAKLVGDSTALILLSGNDGDNATIIRSANNIPTAKTLLANYLNIRDLLGYDKVILPVDALDVISSYLG